MSGFISTDAIISFNQKGIKQQQLKEKVNEKISLKCHKNKKKSQCNITIKTWIIYSDQA